MRKNLGAGLACLPLLLLPLSPAAAATAHESNDYVGSAGVASALDAAGTRVEDSAPTKAASDGFVTTDGAVTLPSHAGKAVVVKDGDEAVQIGFPGGVEADAVKTADGLVYKNAAKDTTIVAKATKDGAQLLAVLDSAKAPKALSFPVVAKAGSSLVMNPDGSVSLMNTTGDIDTLEGTFAAPWAVDANGKAVETGYEIHGTNLVQTINPTADTVYPVTADPTFKFGSTGLFVHWSRSDAKWLVGLSLVATGAALASLCAGPQVALCAAAAASIFYALDSLTDPAVDRIYNDGKRITTRLTPWFSTYVEKR